MLRFTTQVCFLFCLWIPFHALAQTPEKDFNELKQKAAQKVKLGDYYGAIKWYEKAKSRAKEKGMAPGKRYKMVSKLASLNRKIRNYRVAAEYYKLLHQNRSGEYPQARYYWGLMVQQNGQYQKARSLLKKVETHYKGPNRRKVKKRVRAAIAGCQKAIKADKASQQVRVTHLGKAINSAYTELSPIFMDDSTMLYASLKKDSLIKVKRGAQSSSKTRFYIAKKQGSKWKHHGPWEKVSNEKINLGNGTFSENKKRFYFTQCQLNQDKEMICKLYVSEKQSKGDWSEPEKLPEPINKPGVTTTHPTTGKIQKGRRKMPVIYFASDRDGGRGGMDIWYTGYNKKTGNYGNPRNAGRYINTLSDEMTPYLANNLGKLYFSSDGWPGYGGLDIFEVPLKGGRFTKEPTNLNRPINSPADDLYYNTNNKGQGFLVSNRRGVIALKHKTCCDDIWRVKLPREFVDFIAGRVIKKGLKDSANEKHNKKDDKKERKAIVSLYKVKDSGKERILIANDTLPPKDSSRYRFNLQNQNKDDSLIVDVNKKGYFRDQTDTFTKRQLTQSGNQKDLILKPIKKKPIVIPNIYYAFDKAELNAQSRSALDTTVFELLKKNPKLILEIRSHTDSIGRDAYNKKLSQKRAGNIVEYLVKKGINRKRLQPKGFGEERPIAPNTLPDGSDNPKGREKNRRTEFRVIGELKGNRKVIYQE